ncbi:ABC transporter ATP-binding protein/permease [Clostridium sp. AL.422]|uniref:ABC transporter ATP-binding protein/permease n=1 Tax=Clostridium TaxID=1485 RepID=UPI00293DB6A5|nr:MULTISPECIES: ABC transporter ATP-binding protein/permease [unclassified Clostridium]MDV4149391.1 ABC transporter ATP-binding protein/permease [Clostridium sp. AL.422]
MLQIKNIKKQYVTGDLVQNALNDVSLNLRNNEFVAILGPSGSGKTTLLNIIGGLDHYDSGDLIINNISTKKYTDRDWDSYRNHTIGFVFQSYNLIPHQTILSNVELALTISGISKSERRKKAIKALEEVGLGEHIHKKPNQMSGGQMQRVAIARALVNNPDILLADEPTGALDSDTSVQVMELLKEVAKERLVVMVTHNPELAEEYATRIVKVKDGVILEDTDPFIIEKEEEVIEHKNMGKSSMSLLTALSLSFNNLRTKKARTFLTAFAGSIGIIGIAAILSLSTGVNTYIEDIQKDTMTSYPITIDSQAIDLTGIMESGRENAMNQNEEANHELNEVYSNNTELEMTSSMTTSISENNLTQFKKYLDDENSEIHQFIGENGVVYSYDVKFDVFTYDSEDELINTDGSSFENSSSTSMQSPMGGSSSGMPPFMGGSSSNSNFSELMSGTGDNIISNALKDSYDVLYGEWPTEYNEIVLALNKNNEISSKTLYELGLLPASEYKKIMKDIEEGKEVSLETESWTYEDIANQEFYLIPASDRYVKNNYGTFDLIEDNAQLVELLDSAVKLQISGIIRQKEDENLSINSTLGYTRLLTDYLIDYANKSDVVKAQLDSKNVNVLNGMTFTPADDATKIQDARTYVEQLGVSDKANLAMSIMQSESMMPTQMRAMGESQLASMMDQYITTASDEALIGIYDQYISTGNYDDNLTAFGVVSLDAPSSINIYADSFEAKEEISRCIEEYNDSASEENKITYTDYVALLMSSITTIIDVISYVLIAFVGVSLVVSSIMIGIITYISVLERTKEIGILRAIGASKRNISQVFNAETFIIGLLSGFIGVGVTLLLLIPTNAVIHKLTDITTINAKLPVGAAIILIVLSVILTLIGGFIPAKKAAKKDPVTALRTE